MTSLTLFASEWHALLAPVIPHAPSDRDDRPLSAIRIEITGRAIIAVATDRCTIAAERKYLGQRIPAGTTAAACIRLADARASLALFPHTADADPELHVDFSAVPVNVTVLGQDTPLAEAALTLTGQDGAVLVMRSAAGDDPLAGWRHTLAALIRRPRRAASPQVALSPVFLTRWAKAPRKGEQLAVYAGPDPRNLLLVTAGEHFIGGWVPARIDEDLPDLADSQWAAELAAVAAAPLAAVPDAAGSAL